MTIRPLRTADFEAALAIWNRSAAFDQMKDTAKIESKKFVKKIVEKI